MMLELGRCVVAWLSDATYGVNALLAAGTVPRDAGDALPVVATITDEFSDKRAAVGRMPEDLPALVVDVVTTRVIENGVVSDQGDGTVIARVRYADKQSDAAVAKEAGSYVMRAVAQSLRVLNRNQWTPARTRNGIVFRPSANGAIEVRPYAEMVEDVLVTGVCLVTYDLRDTAVLPA